MHLFPELNTDRLTLRKLTVEDFPALVKYADNKKIADEIINMTYPYREPQAAMRMGYVVQGFKAKSRYVFAIILKDRNELIGEISLHLNPEKTVAELGYWVGEPFWGQGLATEATRKVLGFGFETLAVTKIYATCRVQNLGSIKVLERSGLRNVNKYGRVGHFQLSKAQYKSKHTIFKDGL